MTYDCVFKSSMIRVLFVQCKLRLFIEESQHYHVHKQVFSQSNVNYYATGQPRHKHSLLNVLKVFMPIHVEAVQKDAASNWELDRSI